MTRVLLTLPLKTLVFLVIGASLCVVAVGFAPIVVMMKAGAPC